MQPQDLLAQVPLLASLDPTSRTVLARQLESVEVPADATLFSLGDPGDTLFLIQDGTVQVRLHDEDGNPIILATLGPGEYFGEMALLDDQPRSATIVTTTPCAFLTLSRAPFQQLVLVQPGVAVSLLREISGRLRACHRRVADLALLDAYARMGHFLLDHTVWEGGQQVLPARWTLPAIAGEVKLPLGTAELVMRELEREGYVTTAGDRTVILKQLVRPHELVGLLIW
jgi:CRP/FNR family cyclic AMP-dependent transcriptional regulator